MKPKKLTLRQWADRQFEQVPHYNTLLKWLHEGRISPQPEKIGKYWYVNQNAEIHGN